jgi:SPASM domain peptide maturase of grasp-with-spasm system
MKKFFLLYTNNILVKGANDCIIYDLLKCRYKIIPRLLYDVLKKCEKSSIDNIKIEYKHEVDKGIDLYFTSLEQDDWGIFTDRVTQYPPLNLTCQSASAITHAIIEIDFLLNNFPSIEKITFELDKLNCEYFCFIINSPILVADIKKLFNMLKYTNILYVQLHLDYKRLSRRLREIQFWKHSLERNRRIRDIWIKNATSQKAFSFSTIKPVEIKYKKDPLFSQSCKRQFVINQLFFIEAHHRNSCLNGKVYITKNGDIKNCFHSSIIYGNITKNTIQEIIQNSDFCNLWQVTKDDIEICQDCMYRYMCVDCRCFLSNPKNIKSKPSFCKYNPYEN